MPGVCTTWLKNLKVGHSVHIYRRKNDSFKPYLDDGLIMIGAGTGVAPYVGFLDHMKESGNSNIPTLLITGNRYNHLDSIYGDLFTEHAQQGGVLTHYRTAHSRDGGNECKYVQDVLSRDAVQIVSWLNNNARVYVCGDAKGLGVAVFNTFKTILCELKNITEQESLRILSDMKKNKRYCEDIWS